MNKTRILVADDFPVIREYFCQIINGQENMIVVGEAGTEQEIVELATGHVEYDMILMDIEMDCANAGIRATERIRSHNINAQIIFLTAHETESIILSAMATGAVDYIVKGCDDHVIIEHINAWIAGEPIMNNNVQAVIFNEYQRLRKSEQSLLFFINNLSTLTQAERELIKLLLQNKKIREIAAIRYVEEVTIKTQIKGILHKFGCRKSKEVVKMIHDLGLEHLFM